MSKKDRNVLDLLAPERQQEIRVEALASQVMETLTEARESGLTVSDLIAKIQGHEFWSDMAEIAVSDLFPVERVRRTRRPAIDPAIAGKVLAHIKKKPGLRFSEIAEACAIDKDTARRAMTALKKAGSVTVEGEKRSATYAAA